MNILEKRYTIGLERCLLFLLLEKLMAEVKTRMYKVTETDALVRNIHTPHRVRFVLFCLAPSHVVQICAISTPGCRAKLFIPNLNFGIRTARDISAYL